MRRTVEEKAVFTKEKVGLEKVEKDPEMYDVSVNLPFLKEDEITQVSRGLLERFGYFKNGSIRIYYFVDLLNQCREIIKECKKYAGSIDPYFLHEIELPDYRRGQVVIVTEKDGKYSIKLPA